MGIAVTCHSLLASTNHQRPLERAVFVCDDIITAKEQIHRHGEKTDIKTEKASAGKREVRGMDHAGGIDDDPRLGAQWLNGVADR